MFLFHRVILCSAPNLPQKHLKSITLRESTTRSLGFTPQYSAHRFSFASWPLGTKEPGILAGVGPLDQEFHGRDGGEGDRNIDLLEGSEFHFFFMDLRQVTASDKSFVCVSVRVTHCNILQLCEVKICEFLLSGIATLMSLMSNA